MTNTVISPARLALEKVRDQILTESLTDRERIELLGSVDYFFKQLLCETDRREADHVLRQRWRDFERRFVRPGRRQGEGASELRERLVVCLSLRQFFLPFAERGKEKQGLSGFFRLVQERAQKAPELDALEKSLCVLGLEYLGGEARRGRMERDHRMIRKTWRRIHPYLKNAGVLRRIKGVDMDLKTSLLAFLTGVGE